MSAPTHRFARLAAASDRIAKQAHVAAVRDGVVAALPLVLIGSTFLLVAQPPSEALQAWLAPWLPKLLVPYRMLGGLLSLYVCYGTARSLSKRYGMDEPSAPLMALASFLVAVGPAVLVGDGGKPGGFGVAGERLGAGGLFGALVIALASIELQRLVVRLKLVIRLPGGAPEVVTQSFAALIPGFFSVLAVWIVVHGIGFDVVGSLAAAARPLVSASDSLPGAWAIVLVDSCFWLVGVHPMAALAAVKPLWLSMLAANLEASAAGLPPPHVVTREFFLWFVWQGGSGGTLAAVVPLLFSKSRQLKALGRVAVVPALFNINEPLLFGLPIVLNPRLAAPFLLAPLLSATTTWLAMSAGLVSRPRVDVLWTLPAPLGAFLTTGGDWRAVALQLCNLALATAIFWPFLRAEDRRALAAEERAPPP